MSGLERSTNKKERKLSIWLINLFLMIVFLCQFPLDRVLGQLQDGEGSSNINSSDYRKLGPLRWKADPLENPINTERPSFSSSPYPLPRGHLQIEGGYQFTHDGGGEVEDHTLPLLLLRVGLHSNLELQIGWAGYSWTEDDSSWSSDANDLTLGVKTKLLDQEGMVPTIGFLLGASFPTGSGDASSGDVDPNFGVLWTYDLIEGIGLFGNIIARSPTDERDRFYQTDLSAGIGFSLTDRIGTFIEYFVFLPDNNGPSHNLDTALTYLVNDNLQLDINGGIGLNSRADDFYTGAGFAWRW